MNESTQPEPSPEDVPSTHDERVRSGASPEVPTEAEEGVTELSSLSGDAISEISSFWSEGGTRLGSYRLRRELGRGGQGVVYEAVDERIGRRVAIKVLQVAGPSAESMLVRFRREALVASRLDHPGICSVLEARVEGGVPYIAMPLLKGESLSAKIARAQDASDVAGVSTFVEAIADFETAFEDESDAPPVDAASSVDQRRIRELLELFEQAALALDAAHEAGVLHRDVKPANLMIAESGQPVLLDFGLAHTEDADIESLTRTGDLCGTPAYMSPEQLTRGTLRLDRRTDVYSLGASLFECLTLRRPFEQPTREALYNAIMTSEAPDPRRFNDRIPRDVAVVVMKALEKNRERRYATARDLALELRRILDDEPILARPVGPLERVARWARRNRAVAVLLAVLFATLTTTSIITSQSALDARASAEAARREAEAKDRALVERTEAIAGLRVAVANYERLADTKRLDRLKTQAEMLWPARPSMMAALQAWQREAEDLVLNLPAHSYALAELRGAARPYSEAQHATDFAAEIAEVARLRSERANLAGDDERAEEISNAILRLEDLMTGRRSWQFDQDEDTFRHEIMARLVTDLRQFAEDPHEGAMPSVRMRLDRCTEIGRLSTESAEARIAWQAVRERVRSNPRYRLAPDAAIALGSAGAPSGLYDPATGAMLLAPQVGLIPLGPDPVSGLEEFLHLETHTLDWRASSVPTPRRKEGTSHVGSSSRGIVLVLLPAGRFLMGAQGTDQDAPQHDERAESSESPVHEVWLGAFFMARHELTQGQWRRGAERVGGLATAPFTLARGALEGATAFAPRAVDDDHPAETISWHDADRFARRLGLSLPTEAQWEYAARGGLVGRRWAQADAEADLAGLANVSGIEIRASVNTSSWLHDEDHRDAWIYHGPVGSLQPNPFGLHDVIGNVWEWCRDAFAEDYATPPAPGDGLRDGRSGRRVNRGGSFAHPARDARVSYRHTFTPDHADPNIGFRPARPIEIP